MPTPMIFNSLSWSPNTIAEREIVVTSLKIPATDIGTMPVRWIMLLCGIVLVIRTIDPELTEVGVDPKKMKGRTKIQPGSYKTPRFLGP